MGMCGTCGQAIDTSKLRRMRPAGLGVMLNRQELSHFESTLIFLGIGDIRRISKEFLFDSEGKEAVARSGYRQYLSTCVKRSEVSVPKFVAEFFLRGHHFLRHSGLNKDLHEFKLHDGKHLIKLRYRTSSMIDNPQMQGTDSDRCWRSFLRCLISAFTLK